MEKNIEEKVVVVTGGATGLGLAMVENFIEKEAKVLIIVDFNEQQGIDAAKNISLKYGENKAVFYKCDVTCDLDVTFKKVIDNFKYIDVLINNAGILNEKSLNQTIDVNVKALMEWTEKFYDHMRNDKSGRGGTIINVSSIYGFRIIPFIPYYHASKYAVLGYSKSLGHEYNYKKTGVRVVVLCPGLTYTNMGYSAKPRYDETFADFQANVECNDWQNPDAIGKGIIEIFEKAESGTVWLVEGSRPAVMI